MKLNIFSIVFVLLISACGVPTPPVFCSPPAGFVPVQPGAVYTYRLPVEALTYQVSFSDESVRVDIFWDDPSKVTVSEFTYVDDGGESIITIALVHNGQPAVYELLRVYHCGGQWYFDDSQAKAWESVVPTPTPAGCQPLEGFVLWTEPIRFEVQSDLWIELQWRTESSSVLTVFFDGETGSSVPTAHTLQPGGWDLLVYMDAPRFRGDLGVVQVYVCPDGQAFLRVIRLTPEGPEA